MEALCTSSPNLQLAGCPNGNRVYLNTYVIDGRMLLGHSIWRNERLEVFDADSWLAPYVQFSGVDGGFPGSTCRMPELTTYAFEHLVVGLLNRDIGEIIVGLQTMYSWQVINGAKHLPLNRKVAARVYARKPAIVEFVL